MKISNRSIAAALLLTLNVCAAHAQWKPAPGPLTTPWTKKVSPQNTLPEYPRPQLARSRWQNLNGLWSYGLTDAMATTAPATMSGKILVPYPYESALSGVGKPSIPNRKLWYRRTFTTPTAWKGQRILLHFGAVNYDTTVALNGKTVGSHRGGFDGFDFDITPQLKAGQNELVVSTVNPLKADVPDAQVLGKQRIRPDGIFYTGATGIWQTVWLEPVPKAHIESLKITPDIDAGLLRVRVNGSQGPVQIAVMDGTKTVVAAKGSANTDLAIPLKNAKLWSPDAPFLYNLKVMLGSGASADTVNSYAAMRKIALAKDAQGRQRIYLNNKFLFQVGALDQGYWPDGIFTAPTDEALKFDIVAAKRLGWNLLRKHAKVEPARWYYWTDRLGMLVWQDMPQMFGGREGALSDDAKAQFAREWERIIAQNYNAPSIVVWTTFNEGWGQHDTPDVVAYTRKLDPTRLVNNASGWTDQNVGDMHDTHAYPGPDAKAPEANRASVNGEFGGITYDAGHRWVNNVGVMGYGATLKSGWLATKRFQNLMKAAYDLKEQGASAVVYTQLTDVEQEINGVLTYDRAVVKMDAKIATAANEGRFLPLPPDPNPQLVPTSDDEPVIWQYTTEQPDAQWYHPDFDDKSWKTGPAPFGKGLGWVRTEWNTSDLWIRRDFNLPETLPAQLNLLVKHDEDAEIYVNGVLAGTVKGYTNEYKVVTMSASARASLKAGRNTLAVHVHQTVGGQGIDVGIAAP